MMAKKIFNLIYKIFILALLTLCSFIFSCKKPSDKSDESKRSTQSQTADVPKQRHDDETDTRKEPLVTDLPKKVYRGTPRNRNVPNLEKMRAEGEERPPFMVPVGTKNVALGKPVNSTDEAPIIGEIEFVTDGNKEAVDGSYVELGPFLQSVTIDLEAEYEIYAILIWHYHSNPRAYFDVIVQVARDCDFINPKTLFNNDIDNSAGLGIGSDMHYIETNEGKLIDAKGTKARYVRLYSNGNNNNELNHYIEVEVFGKPVK